ncbi:P-loop NTPase fold protein [Knoellia sp. CPCC 206453]|uniref:KAP family P-loop NTPase fold protein n=1 Tax=Knoellia pratensis TaxID=3404796 RepID=UPI00360818F4
MSQSPSSSSSGASSTPYGDPRDPVVAIIENAGHEVDPRVIECAHLAATAHAQRLRDGRADGRAVNRSTFLVALGWVDDDVRVALFQNRIHLEALQSLLGISDEHSPFTGQYELAEDLERAFRTYIAKPRKMQLIVTPWSLAEAILEDVVAHGGLLGDRLKRLGTDAGSVLLSLRLPPTERRGSEPEPGPEPEPEPETADLPLMRDITARQFGVVLPPGTDDPGPYVPRDIDDVLRRQLRERLPVVTVVAQVGSGAIRTAYEALCRERPDDRVLLLHEFLDPLRSDGSVTLEDLDRRLASDADVIWIRFLGELVALNPIVKDWFLARRDSLTATKVLLVRPDDVALAAELGLAPTTSLELNVGLSAEEQSRAGSLYDKEVTAVSGLAGVTARRHGVVRANYAADSAAAQLLSKANDALDVRADVDMLAKLIASKDVKPPLSIGLFGPWGSGKSFLMHQVQLRIKDLADRSRAIPVTADSQADANVAPQTTGYLTEVIPVEFNAWQYAHGTALWAALINKVFEQVRVELTKQNRYEEVMKKLADKDLAVVKARVRLDAAKKKVTEALPAAEDRQIEDVVKKHDDISTADAKQVEVGMQVSVATAQMSELKDEYDRLRPLLAQVARAWSTASWARRFYLVGGLAALGALALMLIVKPDWMIALMGAVVGALGSVLPLVGPVRKGLDQARKILRADARDKDELRRAEVDLVRATEDMQSARMSGLAGLYGFVNDRSKAAEYLQPLGMAPMIRDDLERLAELARGDDGIPGIDRIVIFIDDLDRCPASQVVQVLEAVNLLFGFELFVVVVAVDSRWLLRSLNTEFSAAFDAKDSSAPTAQNYLEKIIQIPFWVQPMRPTGFGRLVTSLAGEVTQSPTTPPQGATDPTTGRQSATPASPSIPTGVGHEDPVGEPTTGDTPDTPVTEPQGGAGQGGGTPTTEPADDNPPDDLNPEALRLTSDERDCMTRFLPLVGTPRAAKRFINTYQLLRVSVPDVELFLASKEYEPVLVLLALVTGTVPVTNTMIAVLSSMTQSDFGTFLGEAAQEEEAIEPEQRQWQPIARACADLPAGALTPELIRTWLPKVARYSFHHVEW